MDELVGHSGGAEIVAFRERERRGRLAARKSRCSLIPATAAPAIFDAAPELFRARVLLIECSFLGRG